DARARADRGRGSHAVAHRRRRALSRALARHLGGGAVKRVALIALFACAACPNLVVRSPRNAPGHVDLATPLAHETGDPAAFETPTDPGEYRAMVLPGGYAGFGEGRR